MMNHQNKKAFAMMTAIAVIVIMATVTALIMNVTGKTIKETTQQYQKEQAALLAKSYTELAVFNVLNTNKNTCLTTFTDHFGDATSGYDILINIKYLGNDRLLDGCTQTILANGTVGTASDATNTATWTNDLASGIDRTISLVVDTYITYKDFDDSNSDRNITFHRRTLQKL